MIKRQLAIVTSAAYATLPADEHGLVRALERRGWEVSVVVWDDPAVAWETYAVALIRCCWDYHQRIEAFRAWLERMADRATVVVNPVPLMRWNLDKRYLQALQAKGIGLIPTEFVAAGDPVDLAAVIARHGWERVIVKPAISGAAYRTWLFDATGAAAYQAEAADILNTSGLLIQEFLPEVVTAGEWSLIFFAGAFSHAVVKRPKANDFRVQDVHGGSAERVEPSAALLAQARAVVAALDAPWLYARVDGIVRDQRFCLMELELIEPNLFFGVDEAAADRLAEALNRFTA